MAYINLKKVTEAKENYLKALRIDPIISANIIMLIYLKD